MSTNVTTSRLEEDVKFAVLDDPFSDPAIRAGIEQELERRSIRARDPNIKQYSTQEIKEKLGL